MNGAEARAGTNKLSASARWMGRVDMKGAIGYWLLAIGYWLLAIGYWLLT